MSEFPRSFRAMLGTLLVAAAVGCSGDVSVPERAAAAREQLAQSRYGEAVVGLKAALDAQPDAGELRYLLGRALLGQGDAGGAVLEFNKALTANYARNQVLPELAKALLALGQAKQVIERFEQESLPDAALNAELKAAVAAALAAQGQTARCSTFIDAALQADPRNRSARQLKARVLAGAGDVDAALQLAQTLVDEAPDDPAALLLKAELLAGGKRDPDAAIQVYRQVLKRAPANRHAHVGVIEQLVATDNVDGFRQQVAALNAAAPNSLEALFYGTELAILERDFKRARELAQRLLSQSPSFGPGLMLAGSISLKNNELALAQTQLEQAEKLIPNVPAVRRLLAEVQLRSGQLGRAMATLKPLLESPRVDARDLALAAEAYLLQGDHARAEALYTQAAKVNPADTKSQVALALARIGRGESAAGLTQLEAAAASDRGGYADLALVSALIRQGRFAQALQAVDRIESKYKEQPFAQLLRARLLRSQGDLAGARANLEKALRQDPSHLHAALELASLDQAEGRAEAALARIQKLAKDWPQNPSLALAELELRSRGGAAAGLEAELRALVERFPTDAQVRRVLIEQLLKQKQSAVAVSTAQEALSALPDNPMLLEALSRAQQAAGDLRQAVASLQKAVGLQPQVAHYRVRLAELYAGMKDFANAKTTLQRALETSPRQLSVQQALMQLALMQGHAPEALGVARQVQTQRAAEPTGYLMEAQVHLQQKSWAAAAEAFQKALTRSPATPTVLAAHAAYLAAGRQADAQRLAADWEKQHPDDLPFLSALAQAAAQQQDYSAAEARFRQVLQKAPDNPQALNNVAALLLLQKKPGALALAERADKLAPNRAALLDTLASAQASEKRLADAVATQRRAVQLAPEVPGYRLNYARLLVDAGRRDEARAELQTLAALGPSFAGQAEVRSLLRQL